MVDEKLLEDKGKEISNLKAMISFDYRFIFTDFRIFNEKKF